MKVAVNVNSTYNWPNCYGFWHAEIQSWGCRNCFCVCMTMAGSKLKTIPAPKNYCNTPCFLNQQLEFMTNLLKEANCMLRCCCCRARVEEERLSAALAHPFHQLGHQLGHQPIQYRNTYHTKKYVICSGLVYFSGEHNITYSCKAKIFI